MRKNGRQRRESSTVRKSRKHALDICVSCQYGSQMEDKGFLESLLVKNGHVVPDGEDSSFRDIQASINGL